MKTKKFEKVIDYDERLFPVLCVFIISLLIAVTGTWNMTFIENINQEMPPILYFLITTVTVTAVFSSFSSTVALIGIILGREVYYMEVKE